MEAMMKPGIEGVMAKTTKTKSNAPLLIILCVLIAAVFGGWWLYSFSKPGSNTSGIATKPSPTTGQTTQTVPPDAPPGANPPNQSGSATASVTLEEFADFQCPHCAVTHPILNKIKSIYGSRIKFIFRNFPWEMHDKSYDAATAAEAAGMQGKFWDMQNMLFTNQRAWTADPNYKQIWKDYAQKIGLNINKWEEDVAGTGAKLRVDDYKKLGKAICVAVTPSLYMNGQAVP